MKQIIFIFMSLLCFSCSSKAQNQTADTNVQSDKKILVAYFSCTGTTEKAADAIAKTVGGKLYQITPATAYTSADLDWNNKSSRSSIEMTTENSRPELGGEALNLKDYDVIFLGTESGTTRRKNYIFHFDCIESFALPQRSFTVGAISILSFI